MTRFSTTCFHSISASPSVSSDIGLSAICCDQRCTWGPQANEMRPARRGTSPVSSDRENHRSCRNPVSLYSRWIHTIPVTEFANLQSRVHSDRDSDLVDSGSMPTGSPSKSVSGNAVLDHLKTFIVAAELPASPVPRLRWGCLSQRSQDASVNWRVSWGRNSFTAPIKA